MCYAMMVVSMVEGRKKEMKRRKKEMKGRKASDQLTRSNEKRRTHLCSKFNDNDDQLPTTAHQTASWFIKKK